MEEKDQFESALEKQVDSYVDAMELEDDPQHNQLLPPKLRREKLKNELKATAKMPELSALLESAITLLLTEGADHFDEKTYNLLISDLSDTHIRLSNLNLDNPENSDLSSLIQMSDQSVDAVAAMATDKFAKEKYQDCLALFSLLSVINPGYVEYWFRIGMAAQKSGNLELATRAYTATTELDPWHIGARLFAAECYIQRTLKSEAKAEYEMAKKIAANGETEKIWLDLMPTIQNLLDTP